MPATAPPPRPGPDRRRPSVLLTALAALALLAPACTESSDATDGRADPGSAAERSSVREPDGEAGQEPEEPVLEELTLDLRVGPGQVTIDRRPEELGDGAVIEAVDGRGDPIGTAVFASNGTALVRDLPPGPVELRFRDGRSRAASHRARPVVIPGEEAPEDSFYAETALEAGFNYLPTRDGTTLSAFVTLPGSAQGGPYPTLVEYSGYSPSDPTNTEDPYRLLIPALGYALVQVNVRGTGCSGGSFDAFERIQSLDGYDVIETIAAQPWAGAVGMFGVSYPGIMQLHVASTRPPSLAAIAPLSVTDGVDSVLYPGGIYNDGFGEEWTRQVGDRAGPNGQPWAAELAAGGDGVCAANQELRVHNPDLVELVKANPFITDLSRDRSARTHAVAIDVPTFIAGAWQDEQTGGRFPALLDELTAVPVLRAVLYNGLHIDAVSGEMLAKLVEFFDLYVADRAPGMEPITRLLLGVGLSALFGDPLDVPQSDLAGLAPAEARRIYEAEPPIEVLFEQGAANPNLPVPGFRARFERWPPVGTEPTELYLSDGGDAPALGSEPPRDAVALSFTTDPAESQLTTIDDLTRIWSTGPGWAWPEPAPGRAVIATSEPLTEDLVLVGNLSADLWVSVSGSDDAAIETTISEVAPDGSETFVQAGWLQLSQRAQSDRSTALRPVPSGIEADREPMEPGGPPVLARVEVLPFAHVFRPGSRLRVTIDTPGASRPQWRFSVADEPVEVTVHSSPDQPSKLVLPVIPDLDVTTQRPACGSLRGQPCRPGG